MHLLLSQPFVSRFQTGPSLGTFRHRELTDWHQVDCPNGIDPLIPDLYPREPVPSVLVCTRMLLSLPVLPHSRGGGRGDHMGLWRTTRSSRSPTKVAISNSRGFETFSQVKLHQGPSLGAQPCVASCVPVDNRLSHRSQDTGKPNLPCVFDGVVLRRGSCEGSLSASN